MGIIYLLVYVIGSFMVTLAFSGLLDSVYDGSSMKSGVESLAKGAGVIGVAAVLHVLVSRRRTEAMSSAAPEETVPDATPATETAEAKPGSKYRAIYVSAAVWAAPNIAAWIQFELFRDPIVMIGFPTLVGGYLLTFFVSALVVANWRIPWVGIMVALAFIGSPLAWLGNSVFIKHFNHHLSTVVEPVSRTKKGEYRDPIVSRGSAPDRPVWGGGIPTELMAEVSEAKTLDLEKELETGGVRRTPEGGYVRVLSDGTERRLRSMAELAQALKDASAAEDQRAAEAEAAWERQVRQLKRGGRLFSRAPAD
ncbi:hypothetical protein A176_006065 [Myxococcus hansupus]|uniref:Uncharacterized protein n=1 Tax=Pseudomyxococcus hansupus TaxID=1297742 RepID=A0A0H4X5K2_9BACT|nr:hypothetical protein [Myxococcus hansupus]AKQ69153.1 hypothetical protein A176_006065 [Myxococcus hansupus]